MTPGRAARILALTLLIAATLAPAAPADAAKPRASFTDVENDVMCVECREPLPVAQSPQADSERAYIRTLIAQGLTKPQIEQNLVAQYGPAVLGKPPASGVNLTVYILPPAIVLAGIAILAVTLPRWRRRSRAAVAAAPSAAHQRLDEADAQRLERELSEFRG
jgi:cytochrome c-type biogenesis protein CcmH/NrfF